MLQTRKVAFALIELSIVLVIIGLAVGDILVGRDLIKSAELKSIYADKAKNSPTYKYFQNLI